MRIRVPKQVGLDATFGAGGDIQIEGGGPFAGIVITTDPAPQSADTDLVLAGRVAHEPAPFEVWAPFGYGSDKAQLKPGIYRLYLLTGGSPATVTLRFDDLAGHVEIAPRTPAQFDARSLRPRVWEESGRFVYSAGESGQLTSRGVLFQQLWVEVKDHVAGRYGTCYYDGEPPPGLGYPPECPQGGGSSFGVVDTSPNLVSVWTAILLPPAGTYGQGAWYASVSNPQKVGATVFWLSLG